MRPVRVVVIREPYVCADDRFYAGGDCFRIKLDHAEQVVLIGQRHRRHAVIGTAPHQFRNSNRTVQERIFRMHVQVHK